MRQEDSGVTLNINTEGMTRLGVVDLTNSTKKGKAKRRFYMTFVDTTRDIELDTSIKDWDRTLLHYLVRRMDDSNEVRLMQREMAADFKTREARISEGVGRLRAAGYITTEGRGLVRINPDFFWRTTVSENEKLVGLE